MPPKQKFTRDVIVETGFQLVRVKGWEGLSTRSLAARLGSSPIPIYSCFKSMKALEPEIIRKILDCQQAYMNRRFTDDPWHDHGIGYVLFALEERLLFLGINDEAHFAASREMGQQIWDDCTAALSGYPPFQGLDRNQVYNVQLKRWMLAHGLAFHACFAPRASVGLDQIILHVREGSQAILTGLKPQFTKKGDSP